jgi:hypothetical protein
LPPPRRRTIARLRAVRKDVRLGGHVKGRGVDLQAVRVEDTNPQSLLCNIKSCAPAPHRVNSHSSSPTCQHCTSLKLASKSAYTGDEDKEHARALLCRPRLRRLDPMLVREQAAVDSGSPCFSQDEVLWQGAHDRLNRSSRCSDCGLVSPFPRQNSQV